MTGKGLVARHETWPDKSREFIAMQVDFHDRLAAPTLACLAEDRRPCFYRSHG